MVQTGLLHWGSGFVGLASWHGGFSHFVGSVDSRSPVAGRVGRMVRHGSTYNWPVMQHAARDMLLAAITDGGGIHHRVELQPGPAAVRERDPSGALSAVRRVEA
ncbi:hypothetical protein MAPG_09937 [Magnaporthiopsis poae ATCC 64411]|uniref:Uncharacterized protein n=1 Tax=Magnaporthiopsis poae (strain ATCC 64411 / 73-15) TaxID=644358 RepID=A0A0C4EB90_MAGP6|nr:hypothetical protein MAPG_09937 [Magnaporthiopsis poae ATCC 64411]